MWLHSLACDEQMRDLLLRCYLGDFAFLLVRNASVALVPCVPVGLVRYSLPFLLS